MVMRIDSHGVSVFCIAPTLSLYRHRESPCLLQAAFTFCICAVLVILQFESGETSWPCTLHAMLVCLEHHYLNQSRWFHALVSEGGKLSRKSKHGT